ncbi:FK506-binding protein 15 [Cephus cinctus]|uniref:FK506-binding protein 15 n=1 Tax=Cephus cinctus TaxID=211228 RepID=A0AAJ7FQV1_CEPCN|nr:FK506-binding protein 15 [Cephus cinctus]XP_015603767.1 FK506-binding protein 15 [Cephus cinctus]XP_024944900.1 FK506-binding protein 15 [Cephus cinctus]
MSGTKQLPNINKIFREEDDLNFLPSGGSNLASIFGTPQKTQNLPTPLRYTSPEQSVSGQNAFQTIPSAKTEVLLAKAIHAFKLQKGHYVSVGKLGMALTGNISTKQYQLILYTGKQDHISIVTITPEFSYSVQTNNYSSYYDANKDNWSILFDNSEASIEFAREIALSRYFSKTEKLDNIVLYQDLTEIKKDSVVKKDDKVSIKYFIIVELMQPLKVASFSTQTVTEELYVDDNWEKLLEGLSVESKRMIFLPPNKQIILGPPFPKDKDVALEIELIKIFPPKEEVSKPPASGKAAILSRMAKMGQSILPKLSTSTTTDSEDTEEELQPKSTRYKRSEASGISSQKKQVHSIQQPTDQISQSSDNAFKPGNSVPPIMSTMHRPLIPVSAFTAQWPQTPLQSQYMTADGQLYPMHQQTIAQPIPAAMDPNLNIFLTESRTQSTEIRMGMAKIADNVQKLLDKFHVLEVQNAATPATDKTIETSLRMLLNLQQVEIKNSELQRNTVVDTSASDKEIEKLTATNQELTATILMLKKELKDTKDEVTDAKKHIADVEQEKKNVIKKNDALTIKINDLEGSLTETREAKQKMSNELIEVKGVVDNYKKRIMEMEDKISELEEKNNVLKKTEISLRQRNDNSSGLDKTREIKRIMNETYQTLQAKFTEDLYATSYIKETIAYTIKNITLQVLQADQAHESQKNAEILKLSKEKTELSEESAKTENEKRVRSPVDLPQFSQSSVISANQDEPPPIPPMDLDEETDWLP